MPPLNCRFHWGATDMYYYQHHIGDFNNATRHLSRIERSIYRDLIELYYDTEHPLTLDVKTLCRKIIAVTDVEVAAVQDVLNEFFECTEDGWTHSRCDIEIQKSHEASEGRNERRENEKERQRRCRERRNQLFSILRKKGIVAPWDTTMEALQKLVDEVTSQPVTRDVTANQEPLSNTQYPEPNNQKPNKKSYTEDFEQAWSLYPRRPGASKTEAYKAWCARLKARAAVEQMMDGVMRYAAYVQSEQIEPQFIKQPATFFGPGEHYLSDWTPVRTKATTAKFDPTAYVNQGTGYGTVDTGDSYTIDGEAQFMEHAAPD